MILDIVSQLNANTIESEKRLMHNLRSIETSIERQKMNFSQTINVSSAGGAMSNSPHSLGYGQRNVVTEQH
jgi:hypothetical protein